VGWNIRVSIAVSEGGFPSQRVPGIKATGAWSWPRTSV
jgi:hypothetical protein